MAALYVVMSHARSLLWESYNYGYLRHPETYSGFTKAVMYLSASLVPGRLAVILFFVLSGFVIHLRQSRSLASSSGGLDFGVRSYLYRRVRRIYPPLLFAIAMTYAVDVAGFRLGFPTFGANPTTIHVGLRHDWPRLIGNLCLVKGTFTGSWGTNAPLWSLTYEWWFYLLYPACLLVSKRSVGLGVALVGALFAMSFWDSLWPLMLLQNIFRMLLLWWLGVLLADVYTGRLKVRMAYLIPLIVLIPCSVGMTRIPMIPQVVSDYCAGLGMVGLMACGFHPMFVKWVRGLDRLKWLGDMSYTLYVTHYPIMIFLCGWLMSRDPEHALPGHFGFAVFGTVLCVAIAHGLPLVHGEAIRDNEEAARTGVVDVDRRKRLAGRRWREDRNDSRCRVRAGCS